MNISGNNELDLSSHFKMNLLRAALALLLSILMGTPLCCCAAQAENPNTGQSSSCCHAAQDAGEDQDQPNEHICACRSKEPREAAKELLLPGSHETEIDRPVVELLDPLVLEPKKVIAAKADYRGGDPPLRQRLARLSCWLN